MKKLKSTLALLLALTMLLPMIPMGALAAKEDQKVTVTETLVDSTNKVYKLIFSAQTPSGVNSFATVFSYDNTKIIPVSAADKTEVTIVDESVLATPFSIVAKDADGEPYVRLSRLWRVATDRTAFFYSLYADTDASSHNTSSSPIAMFEFYYKLKGATTTADLDSTTFRFEADTYPNSQLALFSGAASAITLSNGTPPEYNWGISGSDELVPTLTYTNSDVVPEAPIDGIELSASPTAVVVPTAAAGTATFTLSANATRGGSTAEVLTAGVTYSLESSYSGVSIEGNMVTVLPTAAAGTVKCKAEYLAFSKTLDVTLTKPTAELVSFTVSGDESIAVPGSTSAYAADSGLDQYGATFAVPTVTWSLETAPAGVSIDSGTGVLTVTNEAAAGSVTVKATAGSVTATKSVTITKAAAEVATVTVSGGASTIAVPTISAIGGTNSASTAAFTAEVKDQYGAEMTGQTVIWSIAAATGVSINSTTGVVTVTNEAAATGGSPLTVTATCGSKTGTETISITKAAAEPTFVEIYTDSACTTAAADTVSITIPSSSSTTTTFYTKAYDQYGDESTAPTWTNTASAVDVTNGTVTVDFDDLTETFTLTATSGSASKAITISIVDKLLHDLTGTFANVSATYGDTPGAPQTGSSTTAAGDSVAVTYTSSKPDEVSVDADTGALTYVKATTGTVTITVSVPDSSNYAPASSTYTVTVAKKALTITGLTATPRAYDTTTAIALTGGTLNGKVGSDDVDVTMPTSGTITSAAVGDGKTVSFTPITLSGSTAGNYTLTQPTVTVNISKADPTAGEVITSVTPIYVTTPIATIAAGMSGVTTPTGGTYDLTGPLTSGTKSYNWTYTPADTTNYNTANGSISLTVLANDLSKIEITSSPTTTTYVHGDTLDTTGLVVTATFDDSSSQAVTPTVVYNSGTAFVAGDISVKLRYTSDSITKEVVLTSLTVNKVTLDVSSAVWSTPTSFTFDGTEKSVILTGLPAGVMPTYTENKATNAGNYTAKADYALASGYSGDHYNLSAVAATDQTWSIAQAAAFTAPAVSKSYKDSTTGTQTAQITGIPSNAGTVSCTVGGWGGTVSLITGTPTASNTGLVSFVLSGTGASGNTVIIPVKIASTNYADVTVNVTLTMTDKDVPVLSATPLSRAYNGSAVTVAEITKTATHSSSAVPGSWAFKTTSLTTVAESGTYILVFTPTDGTTYTAEEVSVAITITPATPTGTPTFTAITTAGKTLGDADIKVGTLNPVAGTLVWDLGDAQTVAANTAYGWTFTPTDANYTVLKGSLTPYVVSAPPSSSSSGGSTAPTTSEKAIDAIEKAEDGDTVEITLTGTDTTLSKDVFEAIAGKDITIEVTVGGVVWVIDGKDVPTGGLSAINLGVSTNTTTIPVDVLNLVTGESATMQLELKHDGPFGFTMSLQLDMGSKNSGLFANLYYYNTIKAKMDFVAAVVIGTDGKALLPFNHASEYAVVIDNISHETADEPDVPDYINPFTDVNESNWFYPDVQFAVESGLFNGTSDTTFSPNAAMTRGMLVTVLYRMQTVVPAVQYDNPFADVQDDAYYADAVKWAFHNGIVVGVSDSQFAPNTPITRQQAATILERYMTFKGINVVVTQEFRVFADGDSISDWAAPAVQLMSKLGVINGKPGDVFDPHAGATRAEVAAMLHRFVEAVEEK